MPDRTFSRRQFLRLTAGAAAALTVATALPPRTVQADETPPPSLPQVSDIQDDPDVFKWIAAGFGPLFVAGHFLDTFGRNLAFENLPAPLKLKYLHAGAEWKTWPQAQALYETIPAQVRGGGPDALWRFHKGRDWSHIVPRTVGGPTTARNGIWWTAGKNRSLGPNPMSAVDIADAGNLLRNAAIRDAIVQTARAMAKGTLAGVIIGGMLFSLEIGLQYAEGDITWQEMIEKILNMTLIAGGASFVITGLIVGLSLMFPFLIPIITPVLFVLQIVALIFLVGIVLPELARGWWDVLNDQGLLDGLNDVVGSAENALGEMHDSLNRDVLSFVWEWVDQVAQRFGINRAWQVLVGLFQQMGVGVEEAWIGIAAGTPFVGKKATEIVSSLKLWKYDELELNVEVTGIRQSIGRVVSSEFGNANSTAKAMRRSISEYRKSANLTGANLALAVS